MPFLNRVFSISAQLVGKKSRPSSIYSIEYSQEGPRTATPDRLSMGRAVGQQARTALDDDEDDEDGAAAGPRTKPMTPRRVKRRSGSRSSTRSKHGQPVQHSNPVSRLLEQQERRLAGHSNPTYQSSSQQSLDRPPSSFSNYHGQRTIRTAAAAGQVPVSSHPQPGPSTGSYRNSYRRHQHHHHNHQQHPVPAAAAAPPPYNGHGRPAAYGHTNSETVL
jgi:hypothetical protein